MKEFKLSAKSWHFWLSNFGTDNRLYAYEITDICTYIRRIIRGILMLIGAVLGTCLLVTWSGLSFYDIYVWIADGFADKIGFAGFLFLILSAVGGATALVAKGVDAYREYRWKHPKKEKPSTFVALAYRKFKNKTCFKISFKE